MRTTLNLDDHLMLAVKHRATETGSTISRVIEEALRALLASDAAPPPSFSLDFKTVEGRLLPGVDLRDRDALLDRMDEPS